MSENFVRKTLNVENIEKKETYTLHDLDLVETKNGHVYIRIFKQNAKPDSTDQNAYLYELTNTVRRVNNIGLYTPEQLNNSGSLNIPLVMELQYLPDSIKLTIAGNTSGIYKVNGSDGVFKNEKTTYTVPLTGDSLPDVTLKHGNTVVDVYKVYQADLHQENPLHPEFVKGAKECCERLAAVETKANALEGKVTNLEAKVETAIHSDFEIETSGTYVTISVISDQPDDPAFSPTKPAFLNDIKVYCGTSTFQEVTLDWDERMAGSIADPNNEGKLLHAFYRWTVQINITEDSYVLVEQNGLVIKQAYATYVNDIS